MRAESNEILRVHDHTIITEEEAAKILEVGQWSLGKLFPGLTEDSAQQITLSAGHTRGGCKSSVDVARPPL